MVEGEIYRFDLWVIRIYEGIFKICSNVLINSNSKFEFGGEFKIIKISTL